MFASTFSSQIDLYILPRRALLAIIFTGTFGLQFRATNMNALRTFFMPTTPAFSSIKRGKKFFSLLSKSALLLFSLDKLEPQICQITSPGITVDVQTIPSRAQMRQ